MKQYNERYDMGFWAPSKCLESITDSRSIDPLHHRGYGKCPNDISHLSYYLWRAESEWTSGSTSIFRSLRRLRSIPYCHRQGGHARAAASRPEPSVNNPSRIYRRSRARDASPAKTLSKCASVAFDGGCALFRLANFHLAPGKPWVATNHSAGLSPTAARKSQSCGDLLSSPSQRIMKSRAE